MSMSSFLLSKEHQRSKAQRPHYPAVLLQAIPSCFGSTVAAFSAGWEHTGGLLAGSWVDAYFLGFNICVSWTQSPPELHPHDLKPEPASSHGQIIVFSL